MGRFIVMMFALFGAYIIFPWLPILGQYSGKTVVVFQSYELSANFIFAIFIGFLAVVSGEK